MSLKNENFENNDLVFSKYGLWKTTYFLIAKYGFLVFLFKKLYFKNNYQIESYFLYILFF